MFQHHALSSNVLTCALLKGRPRLARERRDADGWPSRAPHARGNYNYMILYVCICVYIFIYIYIERERDTR